MLLYKKMKETEEKEYKDSCNYIKGRYKGNNTTAACLGGSSRVRYADIKAWPGQYYSDAHPSTMLNQPSLSF